MPDSLEVRPDQGTQVEKEVEEYRNGSARSLILRIAPLGEPPPSEAEIAKRSAVLLAGQDPLAIIAVRRSFDDFILTKEQAASIHVPTLLVVGSADPAIAAVKDYKALRPSVGVIVIDGATHNAPRNARARPEFVAAVLDFISGHNASRK
jgi:pimeloyl-ACP methyl ester carboxylesterase